MNFEYTDQQIAIQAAISKICDQFGDDYWLATHRRRLSRGFC